MLSLMRGVCTAVEFMHTYKMPTGARTRYTAKNPILDDDDTDDHQQNRALLSSQGQQETSSGIETHAPGKEGDVVPWAHRDIKPG